MLGQSTEGSENHVTITNIRELKNAITWGVYRALWFWFLTWLAIAVVLAVIGMALSVSIPKFANTKEKAYVASMKSDLRNLVTAEEVYFADSVKYTDRESRLIFVPTTGNVLGPITLTSDGWTATMSNINSPKKCAIFIGTTSIAPALKEGEPRCE